jgi:hypothetical protein
MRLTALLGMLPGLLLATAGLQASDFLVIEHVDRLRVFNKYQQEATGKDLQLFVPFVPMRIVREDDVFGDGFSRCMQVELEGQVFYLLKDKDGRLTRSGGLGFEKTFANATIILDTIQVLAGKALSLKPIGAAGEELPAGATLFRIFRHGKSTYCRTPGSSFGWLNLSRGKGKTWKVMNRVSAASTVTLSQIVPRVRARMNEANRVLTLLFAFFGDETSNHKNPPQWWVDTSEKAILCTLTVADSPQAFKQSTLSLVNEIENVVLGFGFEVLHQPGRIEIRRR